MSLSTEAFQADCATWQGYKPCVVQKSNNLPDCTGCDRFELGSPIYEITADALKPSDIRQASSIGIIEMGGLGSVLRTTAVSRAIRQANPNAEIMWFSNPRGAKLLDYAPGVTPFDLEETKPKEAKRIVRGLDGLINFELTDQVKPLVLQAKKIGGFALNAQGNFRGVSPNANYFQRLQIDDDFRRNNTLTMQQVLLNSVGLNDYEPVYDLTLRDYNHSNADHILTQAFPGNHFKGYVALNVGASEKGNLKRWPAEKFAELANTLSIRHPDMGVLIANGPDDEEMVKNVKKTLVTEKPNVSVLPGDIEVGDFLAILSKSNVVVTADTFGFHAARSQNTQSIVLTGPMPHKELEVSEQDILLEPKVDCAPCYLRCFQDVLGMCMQSVSVAEVLDSVELILADYRGILVGA